MKKKKQEVQGMVPVDTIAQSILLLRGHKIILDSVLAGLYGVETRALIQAVNRNLNRFPEDFMFRLTTEETEYLRSQIVILKKRQGERISANIPENLRSQFVISNQRGGRRYLPYAFTEQGVAMLSSVLRNTPSPFTGEGWDGGKTLNLCPYLLHSPITIHHSL
jgi:hypothetical protein